MHKNIQKYRRRKIYKNIGASKKLGGYKNIGASKIFGECQNLGAPKNFWRLQKCWCTGKLGARQCWSSRKVGGPAEELPYCLGSAESATADFSQAPLMVSFSSFLMC
jgi:hypothetical protein